MLVVRPVLKIKTGFWGLKPNKIWDFESLQRYGKKIYVSVHELYCQEENAFVRYFELYKLCLP